MEEKCILGFDEVFCDGLICNGLPEDGTFTEEEMDKLMQECLHNK